MRLRGSLALFVAAFIWGTTFVAQSVGMEGIGPFTYGAARYVVAGPVVFLLWLFFAPKRRAAKAAGTYRPGFKAGALVGVILFLGTTSQQVGMQYTTVGKTAFITCLYLVLVPLAAVFFGSHIRPLHWGGAVLALSGLYLLSMKDGFSLSYGDAIMVGSSLLWTMHILCVGRFASFVDAVELSLAQLFVCACASLALAFLFEQPTVAGIEGAATAILYAGIMSSGVAFTLQIVGQQYAEPALAAVIMSLESVFGALSGAILLGESMSAAELSGCALMLAGMLLAQLAGVWGMKRPRTEGENGTN